MKKKQKIYEDIRVFCTVLVVIGHCTSLLLINKNGIPNLTFISSIENITEMIRKIIYSFHMPLFVSLSGAVFSITIYEQKGLNSFIIKKLKRLFIPFLTVGLFILLPVRFITGYYSEGFSFKIIIHDYFLAYDVNYLWYLIMLFEVEIIFYLIYKCKKSYSLNEFWILILLFIVSISAFILPTFPLQINKVLEFGFWFYVGCLINDNKRSLPNDKLRLFGLALIWIIAFVLYTWLEGIIMSCNKAVIFLKLVKMIIRYIMEGSAIILIYSIFLKFPLKKNAIYRIIVYNSMAIYLLHCPIIYIYKFILSKVANITNISSLMYVFLLLLGIILSICLSSFINWVYRWLKFKFLLQRKGQSL